MTNKFSGTGVAIVTPFSDGGIDHLALRSVVDHVIDGGVDFIVALGSTGEAATISDQDARKVLDTVIDQVNGKVSIVAGNFGSNNTHALIDKIKEYNFEGIDAILSASPSYSKPSQKGIFEHFTAIAEACPIPVILYNVPSRTASNVTADTTISLSSHDNIIGVKEASGDLTQAKEILRAAADNFFVTSGDDVLAPAIIQSGGVGVISVIANAYPSEFSKMISHFLNGEDKEGRFIEDKLYDFHNCLYAEGNPPGVKAVMEILNICNSEVRLPLTKISSDLYRKLVKMVKEFQL